MHPSIVYTIAGSDPSGGAGVQADLKTIAAHGCYGCAVVTALTAQNTHAVRAVHVPPADFFRAQLKAVLQEFAPNAIKIGMLPNPSYVAVLAEALRPLAVPIVLDPVLVATSGSSLSSLATLQAARELLFPMATLITPNYPEAAALTGRSQLTANEVPSAAQSIGKAVLLKGGHGTAPSCDDYLWLGSQGVWLRSARVGGSRHGTGCTLSSAIACHLALGASLASSCKAAKQWLLDLLASPSAFPTTNPPLFHNERMALHDPKRHSSPSA